MIGKGKALHIGTYKHHSPTISWITSLLSFDGVRLQVTSLANMQQDDGHLQL
jgi:hypothetical protein